MGQDRQRKGQTGCLPRNGVLAKQFTALMRQAKILHHVPINDLAIMLIHMQFASLSNSCQPGEQDHEEGAKHYH